MTTLNKTKLDHLAEQPQANLFTALESALKMNDPEIQRYMCYLSRHNVQVRRCGRGVAVYVNGHIKNKRDVSKEFGLSQAALTRINKLFLLAGKHLQKELPRAAAFRPVSSFVHLL